LENDIVISPELRAWARSSVGRIGNRVTHAPRAPNRKKLLLVHLDGVPYDLLENAVQSGDMPFLSSLVRSGLYQRDSAFWGSPASTPCFQAGVLYGIRHPNLPAYSWFDRELGRSVRMNAPLDALAIEDRLGVQGNGSLLEGGGTAYLSLFRAHASNRLCMTSLADVKQSARAFVRDLRGLGGASRRSLWSWLGTLFRDTWHSGHDVVRWARQLNDWRHEREFWMNRLFMCELAWNVAHSRALVDMVRGVPAIYLVFGNYDEIAHRRGPRSPQATAELRRADGYLAQLYAVAKAVDQPYDLCFVTDHGHVDSTPIERRLGKSVEAYLLHGPRLPLSDDIERALLDDRSPRAPLADRGADVPVVVEAGNFAHVYLTREGRPLEALELLAHHRDTGRSSRGPSPSAT
jgi:hypothetical protein